MRVIAGKARRLPLKTIEGLDTRPTTDRIKETLFNMLSYDLADAFFLDLFAGSGAIGIEALSRGAKKAWFVEKSPKACACIQENLKTTKLVDDGEVLMHDAVAAVRVLSALRQPMDFIFMDPPYNHLLEKDVLEALQDSPLVDAYTTIIVEADLLTDFSYVESLGFEIAKEKKYKTNKHVFIVKSES